MSENKLIKEASKSNFILPAIGTFAFAFMLFNISAIISGNAVIKLLNIAPSLNDYFTHLELFSNMLLILIFLMWARLVEKRSLSTMGLFKKGAFKDSAIGFAIGSLAFIIIVLIMTVMGLIEFGGFNLNFKTILGIFIIIPFWLIQAGSEEIFSRGFVLPLVSVKWGKMAGIILSTVVFTLIHLGNRGISVVAVINIVLVGIFLAFYALYAENIWGAIGFHAAWNYVQACILGLPVSGGTVLNPRIMTLSTKGNNILTGASFGVEASIVTTVILTALSIIMYLKYKKKKMLSDI